jgi:threonine/homoserine/homoserine lactone efflux protein
MDVLHLLSLGILSSFVGALPLGMLNLTVLQLSLANQQRQAVAFSLGASIVELIQIFSTFLAMHLLLKIPNLNSFMAFVSIPVLLYLGFKNFNNTSNTEGGKLTNENAFWQGVILSFANVLVYPFWLLWGNLFVQNAWLKPEPLPYFFFALGASLGTFAAFCAFILLGKVLWRRLQSVQYITNKLIAFAFFGFAGFQIFNLIKRFI